MELTFERPDWIELRIADGRLEAARGFYGRLLELEAEGPPTVYRAGERRIFLRGLMRPEGDPRGALIDLRCPDLLVTTEALMEAGAVWLEEICALPDGGWTTDLIDPFGVTWRLFERPSTTRSAAMIAYAARYLARVTTPGRRTVGATPTTAVGRFGHCAEGAELEPEAHLGPPHLHAFDGDRRRGATRAWRFVADDGMLVEVAQRAGEGVQLFADPPDRRRALEVLGLPAEGWRAGPATEPESGVPGPFRVLRQDAHGHPLEVCRVTSDHAARRWVEVLEARGPAQIYWVERASVVER